MRLINLISNRLQVIAAIVVMAGALIKILHLHSSGDYLLFAGFFSSGIAGIIEFVYSQQRNFSAFAKLTASIIICLAVIFDLTLATSIFPFAIVLLAISFFSSAMPNKKYQNNE